MVNMYELALSVLRDYNLALSTFLTLIICVLQFGYASRNMFFYWIKIITLWLMWPFAIVTAVFSCLYPPCYEYGWAEQLFPTSSPMSTTTHNSTLSVTKVPIPQGNGLWSCGTYGHNINITAFVFAIIFAIFTCAAWLFYWIQSTRLYLRVRSWWAFSPDTNYVAVFKMANDQYFTLPLLEIPMVLSLVYKNNFVYCNGTYLGRIPSMGYLPASCIVGSAEKIARYRKITVSAADGSDANVARFGTVIYAKDKYISAGLAYTKREKTETEKLYSV
uniref:Membrane protein n=1 Tax=Bottlenose dolphin coronavirus HKU22 TaxID=1433215 RepID=V5TGF3_BWCOV|nr:membrane protein [Bottlenose dolphin coronavirus HKU22]